MALVTCLECKESISTDAKICPKCGAKQRRTSLITKIVAVFLGLVGVSALLSAFDQSSSPAPAAKPANPTSAESAAEKKRQDREINAAVFAKMLRSSMRNPDSFQLSEVLIMDKGATCYTYRAQNGFGGMNVGNAVLAVPVFKTSEEPGFVKAWNKYCGNRTGSDVTEHVKYLMTLTP